MPTYDRQPAPFSRNGHLGEGALDRGGHPLKHIDQPGGGLQHRQPLRQLGFAEGVVEQLERALVTGVGLRRTPKPAQPLD